MWKIDYEINIKIFFAKLAFVINVIKLIIKLIFFSQFKIIVIFFAKNNINNNNIN